MAYGRTASFSIAFALLLAALSSAQNEAGLDQDLEGLLPSAAAQLGTGSVRIRQAIAANRLLVAEEEARGLLRASPENWEGLYWLGLLEVRRGDVYPAIRHLTRARELHPAGPISKALGVAYYLVRQHRLFQRMMAEAVQADPADFAAYYYLGRFYESDVSDFARAAQQFQKAIERNPAHFRSQYHLGFTFEAAGETERAEAAYRRAIGLAEHAGVSFADPWLGLARLRLASQRNEEALDFARKAVTMAPQDPAARKILGKIFSTLNRPAEAIREWEAAASLDPLDTGTLYRLYQDYRNTGDKARAEAALKRYKKIAGVYGPG